LHIYLSSHLSHLILSQKDRNNRIYVYLQSQLHDSPVHNIVFASVPKWRGIELCWGCVGFLFGTDDRSLSRRKQELKEGHTSWSHGGKGQSKRTKKAKGESAFRFIEFEKECYGENAPTEEETVELPPGTKTELWIEYKIRQEARKQDYCQFQRFRQIWQDCFPNLKIPSHPRWVKCKVCAECKRQLELKDLDPQTRSDVLAQKKQHRQLLYKERKSWHERMRESLTQEDCLTIYLDAMDQEKTDIPRLKYSNCEKIVRC